MRKLTLLLLSTLTIAIPLHAAQQGRSQSYFTFDDGGTIVRQAEDGREIDARVNLPVFPGDEVITNRRGRAEIRLSDGNIIALDRSTAVRFRSILDSYEGDSAQTVVELRYGHIAVLRADDSREALRLDTPSASYAANDEALYSVDADSRGADRISVFDGEIEVRTPARTTRVRQGEEARVDGQGLYGLVSLPRGTADEFERWFIRRSERYGRGTSRYLDRSLAYSDYDLRENGSWTYVSSLGSWGWRPYVSVGWRPYYHGHWGYRGGSLVWISYEPWGWVPYHYGRWSYVPLHGWVWLPGYNYSPAWVYWMYGPGYFGWAPAGWYDCYRPYYPWAYQPYVRAGFGFGFGFYGRVRVNEIDLRPWTFVSPNSIISTRVDQAALTTDAIRQRLQRDPNGGLATVSGTPARFTRSDLRDPAAAVGVIARRGIGSGTGREGSGSTTDMTPFFRRDPELSNTVRERIVRSVPEAPRAGIGSSSGVPAPNTPGTIEGRIPPRSDRGDSRDSNRIDRGSINRDGVHRDSGTPSAPQAPMDRSWRDRIDRSGGSAPIERPSIDRDRTAAPQRPHEDSWRGRAVGRGEGPRDSVPRGDRPSSVDRKPVERAPVDRGSDIPRRIIDRIGGARIYGDTPRDSAPRNSAPREAPPRMERPSPAPSSPPPQQSAPPPQSRGSEGGHIKRDQ
jgi:hypothetical protein